MRLARSLLVLFTSLSIAACGAAVFEPVGQPPVITGPSEEIVARYTFAITNVCETGVTQELVALYYAVDKVWSAQPTGSGRGSNFGGARDPYMAWWACFQSPGAGWQ